MDFAEMERLRLVVVVIATLLAACSSAPGAKQLVFFHNTVPSNLYVNAAQGPVHIKDDPHGKTEIIRLLLYPSDKRSRAAKTARAVINTGSVSGILTLRQDNPPTGPTFVAGTLHGLIPGNNELQIYEFGDIEDNCSSIGRVYDPYNVDSMVHFRRRHTGDLGPIMADGNGKAEIAMSDSFISLVGPRSVIGRSIVVTNEDSLPGTAMYSGCGVIGFAR